MKEKLNLLILRIKYRIAYYHRIFMHFIGFCPKCREKVNYTRNGQAICPNCRQR